MLHTNDFPFDVVGNDSANFLDKVTLFCDVLTCVLSPRAFFVHNFFNCGRVLPMSGWICQWKPFCVPVGDNFQKAYYEEWSRVCDDSTSDPGENSTKAIPTANVSTIVRSSENQNCTVKNKQPMEAPSALRPTEQPDAPTWELLGLQGSASFWERTEAPLPHQNVGAILFTRSSSVLFLNAWSCRFPVKRSCRAMRMWFPPAKTFTLRGQRLNPTLLSNHIWLMCKRPSHIIVRQLYEGKNQPPKNISPIPTCQTALAFKRG